MAFRVLLLHLLGALGVFLSLLQNPKPCCCLKGLAYFRKCPGYPNFTKTLGSVPFQRCGLSTSTESSEVFVTPPQLWPAGLPLPHNQHREGQPRLCAAAPGSFLFLF